MRCSSRAEGAVLDGGRSVAGVWGGVWRPSVGSGERWKVKMLLGYQFLTFLGVQISLSSCDRSTPTP